MSKLIETPELLDLSKQIESMDDQQLSIVEKDLAKLPKLIENKRVKADEERKQAALAAMEEAANAHGFKVSDLLEPPKGKKARSITPKYAHPSDPSLTWTGMGRRPKWVVELEDAGQSREEFLIK